MGRTLGVQWRGPLCLYGLDGPYELAGSEQSRERIREYARTFAGEKR